MSCDGPPPSWRLAGRRPLSVGAPFATSSCWAPWDPHRRTGSLYGAASPLSSPRARSLPGLWPWLGPLSCRGPSSCHGPMVGRAPCGVRAGPVADDVLPVVACGAVRLQGCRAAGLRVPEGDGLGLRSGGPLWAPLGERRGRSPVRGFPSGLTPLAALENPTSGISHKVGYTRPLGR